MPVPLMMLMVAHMALEWQRRAFAAILPHETVVEAAKRKMGDV